MSNCTNGTTLRERLFSRLIIDPQTGCLLWTGSVRYGYGRIWVDGADRQTHRVMYEMFIGPVPDGLELDHLCRVRRCAAPAHLEAVTRMENQLRAPGTFAAVAARLGDRCRNGHEFDLLNTYWGSNGKRRCRMCSRAAFVRRRAAREAPVPG